jgi:hypothetical protein
MEQPKPNPGEPEFQDDEEGAQPNPGEPDFDEENEQDDDSE